MTDTLIHRIVSPDDNFTMLRNDVINDDDLDMDELALLTYMLAKPPDWRTNPHQLAKRFRVPYRKILKVIRGLIRTEYAKRVIVRDAKNRIRTHQYIVTSKRGYFSEDEQLELMPEKATRGRTTTEPGVDSLHVESSTCGKSDSLLRNERPHSTDSDKTPKAQRARSPTRIPSDFQPDLQEARRLGLTDRQATTEAARFRDYYLGAPGAKGLKRDWPATWRNWCRRAIEWRRGTSPPRQQRVVNGFAARAIRLAKKEKFDGPTHVPCAAPGTYTGS